LANTKSAQKAMRQAETRARRNQAARSAVRTYVKNAAAAVADGRETTPEVVRSAVRALDKAAQKGIIHRNAAARRKSRLMARLHQLSLRESAAAEQPEAAAPKATKAPAKGRATASKTATAEKKPAAKKPAARKTTKSDK
jgi:small subunit ribosomal protein S20